jgi:diacylglycerol kinase (ATP)
VPTHLVIVNPTAGRGVAKRVVPRVTQMLKEHGLSFDLAYTERPWHAAELARQAASNGYEVVAALGGDGTSNEVLNGLVQAQEAGEGDAALGVLCVGTGNDFAYGVGISLDLEAGCAALARGRVRTIDVGRAVGFRYFGNGIGIGFDAVANVQAARIKRLRGFALYLVAVLRTLLFYYRAPLTLIEGDDWTLEQPTLLVSIMNGRRLGGGFLTAPYAAPDDGLFDLCIGAKMNQLQMLAFVPRFMRGTQVGRPKVTMAQSRRVRVTVKEGTQVAHADGETICLDAEQMEFELLPGRLRVVY